LVAAPSPLTLFRRLVAAPSPLTLPSAEDDAVVATILTFADSGDNDIVSVVFLDLILPSLLAEINL